MLGRIIALLILLGLAGLLVWQYKAQYAVLDKRRIQQQEAAASQATQVQQHCADSARERVRRLGLADQSGVQPQAFFNPALQQCYMLIKTRRNRMGTLWKNATLYDANGRVFGSFGWNSGTGGGAMPPYTCEVTLPSGERRTCASESEFNRLIRAYLP